MIIHRRANPVHTFLPLLAPKLPHVALVCVSLGIEVECLFHRVMVFILCGFSVHLLCLFFFSTVFFVFLLFSDLFYLGASKFLSMIWITNIFPLVFRYYFIYLKIFVVIVILVIFKNLFFILLTLYFESLLQKSHPLILKEYSPCFLHTDSPFLPYTVIFNPFELFLGIWCEVRIQACHFSKRYASKKYHLKIHPRPTH